MYLLAIWASLAVSKGSSQGLFFEPTTMQPMLDSPAMKQALWMWGQIAVAAVKRLPLQPDASATTSACDPDTSNSRVHDAFSAGRCALTLASIASIKALMTLQSSSGSGDVSWNNSSGSLPLAANLLGVAPLPGSPFVLDQRTGLLANCTKELCPYGDVLDSGTGIGKTGIIVNRAPLVGVGSSPVGLVSAQAKPWRQALALLALGRLAGVDGNWELLQQPLDALGPIRTEQLLLGSNDCRSSSSSSEMEARWATAGYDVEAVAAMLAETHAAACHHNAVGPLKVPGSEEIM